MHRTQVRVDYTPRSGELSRSSFRPDGHCDLLLLVLVVTLVRLLPSLVVPREQASLYPVVRHVRDSVADVQE